MKDFCKIELFLPFNIVGSGQRGPCQNCTAAVEPISFHGMEFYFIIYSWRRQNLDKIQDGVSTQSSMRQLDFFHFITIFTWDLG